MAVGAGIVVTRCGKVNHAAQVTIQIGESALLEVAHSVIGVVLLIVLPKMIFGRIHQRLTPAAAGIPGRAPGTMAATIRSTSRARIPAKVWMDWSERRVRNGPYHQTAASIAAYTRANRPMAHSSFSSAAGRRS